MSREPDLLPDWFVGGAGKRRLLHALAHPDAWVDEPPPWSKKALARLASLNDKQAVNRHIAVLSLAKLLVRDGAGYRLNEDSPLLPPIRELTDALQAIAPRKLPESQGR